MTDYIDINDLPPAVVRGKWLDRIEEWQRIPPGKAQEITNVGEGQKAHNVCVAIKTMLARERIDGLRAEIRAGRVFVVREAKA